MRRSRRDFGHLGIDGVAWASVGLQLWRNQRGSVTLEDLSAEYCFLHRGGSDPLNCGDGAVTITTLTKTSIGSFEDTSAYFPTGPGYEVTEDDAEVDRFTVQVTLYGLDNEGKEVSIKTAKTIEITSSDLRLAGAGAVSGYSGSTTADLRAVVSNVHLSTCWC